MKRDLSARVCIIGAGISGITAAKHLIQVGLTNFVIYEKTDQIGGNWVFSLKPSQSSVFETTHIISSKTMSQFADYPMPADYPDYPSHKQMLAYFQNYTRDFGIEPYIRFNTEVTHAEKQPDDTWKITLGDGSSEMFDHLIVANGHHWNPRWPEYPGEFSGEFLHSHDYKTAAPFCDKRVLVIGGGNSACDIAVETGRVSAFTAISWRRGYYLIPKFMMGMPIDVFNSRALFLPKKLRERIMRFLLRMVVGTNKSYGLQQPNYPIYASHPVPNSELLYFIKHGTVHPRRDVKCFEGKNVHFVDGMIEEYDVIIAATGFYITFPFFDKNFIDYSNGDVPLFLRVFHPNHPSLAFIGLVQPQGSIWPLADAQAKLIANYIVGNYEIPPTMREQITKAIEKTHQTYLNSPRHSLEVDFHEYLNELLKEIPTHAPEWKEVKMPV